MRVAAESAQAKPRTLTITFAELGWGTDGVTHSTEPSGVNEAGTAVAPMTQRRSSPTAAKPEPRMRTTSPPPTCAYRGTTPSHTGGAPSSHQLKDASVGPQVAPPSMDTSRGTVPGSEAAGARHRTTVERTRVASTTPRPPKRHRSWPAAAAAKLTPSTETVAPCPTGAARGAHSDAEATESRSTSASVREDCEMGSSAWATPPPRTSPARTGGGGGGTATVSKAPPPLPPPEPPQTPGPGL
mmetsp:Transcript_14483/g.44107  ORF Transcript_14483/g.44107 Transcript_14483/m.44107 type:complete len:242 (-) Transcript_14483:3419-4144(-)